MAPLATIPSSVNGTSDSVCPEEKKLIAVVPVPSDSPAAERDEDDTYQYAKYKPSFPKLDWEPLQEQSITHRGLQADPDKKALFSAAQKVKHLTPAIGSEILGLDLRQLSDTQKDELYAPVQNHTFDLSKTYISALLVAERGVVFFRNQAINIHEQLELSRYFGPLHKHASSGIPREPGLEEVHVVYSDAATKRPDPTTISKIELFHTDVSYEIQPPSVASLKLITTPEVGGDTIWSSGRCALYSSLSPGFQKYLEGLSAVHSVVGARAPGQRKMQTIGHVRRAEIETVHPVVRVHPVTGWKSVYVNATITRRIVGVPKPESDTILQFLFRQISENPDFQVRYKWETNDVAFWDNRSVYHSAIFDYWPERRHGLRTMPHGERPLSVEEYEKQTGKEAKDWQTEIWKRKGISVPVVPTLDGARGV
ncbi:hypothetical protein BU17DRAFT_80535 [Hysterangium stoloniferum]|nr:hypothetical protein BU17DRAFT_80535 [Hysterangium stoloniferum]